MFSVSGFRTSSPGDHLYLWPETKVNVEAEKAGMTREGFMDKRGLENGCERLNKQRAEKIPGCRNSRSKGLEVGMNEIYKGEGRR